LARRRKGADGSPSPLSLDGVRRWEDLHLGRDAEVPRHLEDPLVLRAVTEESEPPVRVVVSNPPEGAYEVHEALRTDEPSGGHHHMLRHAALRPRDRGKGIRNHLDTRCAIPETGGEPVRTSLGEDHQGV